MLGKALEEKHLFFYWGMALLLAISLTVLANPGLLGQPFGWVSAHFSMMARTFAELGVGALGGVPIQNNPPLTSEPDAYLHFPPLFPIALSTVFRQFGASDTVGYVSMLVLTLATSVALYFLVATLFDKKAGLFSAFAFLTLPVTFTYGHYVLPLRLALFLMLIALTFYIKALVDEDRSRLWLGIGALVFALSVAASWEPLLLCAGLLAYALVRKERLQWRAALTYSFAGGAAVLIVVGLYALRYPNLLADLWSVIWYRTGLVDYSVAQPTLHQLHPEYAPKETQLWLVRVAYKFMERLLLLGSVGLLALALVAVYCWIAPAQKRQQLVSLVIISLTGMWLLWALLMMQHFFNHEYQWMLAAPVVAVALGVAASWLMNFAYTLRNGPEKTALLLSCLIVLPIILLHRQAVYTFDTVATALVPSKEISAEPDLVAYGSAIRDTVPSGSIVLSPSPDMTPVFYSKRHTIMGVTNNNVLIKILPELHEKFNSYPIYLAFPPSEAHHFARAMQNYRIAARNDKLILLDIMQPNADRRLGLVGYTER